jgi:CheY-like chemotaxis protein
MLDILMRPGINGRETYERILAFRPGQRAIIVSGFADSSEISRTLQLGASQLVKKTIHPLRAWSGYQDGLAKLRRDLIDLEQGGTCPGCLKMKGAKKKKGLQSGLTATLFVFNEWICKELFIICRHLLVNSMPPLSKRAKSRTDTL